MDWRENWKPEKFLATRKWKAQKVEPRKNRRSKSTPRKRKKTKRR